MSEQPDLSTLLSLLKSGDTTAMQSLYDLYAAQLLRVCVFRLGEVEAAQEVVQDVFVQAWRGLHKFEYRGEAAFTAWLHTIANNAVMSYLRKHRRQASVSLDADGDWPQLHGTDMARSVCDRLALRQAITRLSPAQQQVVELRYVAGLTNGEIALALARPEGAVKALHHRALQRLHQLMTAEAEPAAPKRRVLLPA